MSLGVIASSYLDAPPLGGGSVKTLTIAGRSATRTNFVSRVDLAHMDATWWASVTEDGGNIRVKQAGVTVPTDLVWIDAAAKTGEVFFKATLTASTNVFTIEATGGGTMLAVTDPNGRNAVWSDYDAFVHFAELVNRTGSGVNPTIVGTASSYEFTEDTASASPDVTSHQGVARDSSGNFYVIATNRIRKYSPTWTLLATNADPLGSTGVTGVDHMGDATVVGTELFAVFENYTNTSTFGNMRIGVWSTADLSFKRSYDISANGHEASGICYNSADGYFYVTDFTPPGASLLHKYDSSFNHVGTVALSAAITGKQGIEYYSGKFYISAGGSGAYGKLYRCATDGTGVTLAYLAPYQGIEGIAGDGAGNFHVLFSNFDGGPAYVRRLVAGTSGLAGWLNVAGSGNAKVVGLPKRTSWTMGASIQPSALTGNHAALSYSDDSGTDANRASLLRRGTGGKWNLWNSAAAFLADPGANVAVGTRYRLHHTQNGATITRTLYRAGALAATGTAQVSRPGGAGNTLFIGAEDSTYSERFSGSINYVYLRNGELDAGWLADEYASWETPASFYTVS